MVGKLDVIQEGASHGTESQEMDVTFGSRTKEPYYLCREDDV
jgi:hypothetical protein